MAAPPVVAIHFSDFFEVDPATLKEHGAFNISLLNDLPLFIDPFLLFNSERPEYRALHDGIIKYVKFLRDKSEAGPIKPGLLTTWFTFPEVKQNWLGYSFQGNAGSGLGLAFARALNANLNTVFKTFGAEEVTRGSHLEKLCLIEEGIGRDNISDFVTNLIKGFLLEFTQSFAQRYLDAAYRRAMIVQDVHFNYDTESWQSGTYELPYHPFLADYVILTPKDLLTKDDNWISRHDLLADFEGVVSALPNEALRAQVNNYFLKKLPDDSAAKDRAKAVIDTLRQYPEIIEHYIRLKEDSGDEAVERSMARVRSIEDRFVTAVRMLADQLAAETKFYHLTGETYREAMQRVLYLKDVVENKGGHAYLWRDNEPISHETEMHILYRLTWFGTQSDVSREVNDGRGPADFKVSRGAVDKTIVEFKLGSNSKLRRNLQVQAEVYAKASDASGIIKVILYFSKRELERVQAILSELGLSGAPGIVLVDARNDNKPSASRA